MHKVFAFDLHLARRKSGLTQEDCAKLLETTQSRYSRLERGDRMPDAEEICLLSLIFGRSFESFYCDLFRELRRDLPRRLADLPPGPRLWPLKTNRERTLARLASRLAAETEIHE